MNNIRTYRGKYPNNVRAVWSGKDRIVHIETMIGERFSCTGEQARYVNPRNLPKPGEDSTPYRNAAAMPITSVIVSPLANATAIRTIAQQQRALIVKYVREQTTYSADSVRIAMNGTVTAIHDADKTFSGPHTERLIVGNVDEILRLIG